MSRMTLDLSELDFLDLRDQKEYERKHQDERANEVHGYI